MCHNLLSPWFWTVCISVFKKIDVLFYYFYTKMLCTGCGIHQRPTKNNTAEQNLLILQFLSRFVNSAHVVQFCACRIAEF